MTGTVPRSFMVPTILFPEFLASCNLSVGAQLELFETFEQRIDLLASVRALALVALHLCGGYGNGSHSPEEPTNGLDVVSLITVADGKTRFLGHGG